MKKHSWIRLAAPAALAMGLVIALATSRKAGPGSVHANTPMPSVPEPERATAEEAQTAAIGHVRGSADAPVTVIEFSDFGCPYCGRFALETYPALEREYIRTGKVQWRYVTFVLGIFPNGEEAARAAECAAEQGEEAFWRMHDLLYGRQGEWKTARDPEPRFVAYAKELGLDAQRFAACYREDRAGPRIDAGNRLARQAGVRATPTFFINGLRVQGALPVEQFRMILDQATR
ncbi:MAG TPA: thioredoxin domain-containing protein [Longimicrobiales bacterium]